MPNTAKTSGNDDTRTFINAMMSIKANAVFQAMDFLNVNDRDSHERAVRLMGDLMDEIGDVESHPLNTFMDLLTDAIHRYENQIYGPPAKVSPLEMLKYFMDAHNLKQTDLKEIFGSQGNVSQVLKGEREINLHHARKLAERFQVSTSIFV
jgi:HTH-type transcriptional regulator/antitoxin HigA